MDFRKFAIVVDLLDKRLPLMILTAASMAENLVWVEWIFEKEYGLSLPNFLFAELQQTFIIIFTSYRFLLWAKSVEHCHNPQ